MCAMPGCLKNCAVSDTRDLKSGGGGWFVSDDEHSSSLTLEPSPKWGSVTLTHLIFSPDIKWGCPTFGTAPFQTCLRSRVGWLRSRSGGWCCGIEAPSRSHWGWITYAKSKPVQWSHSGIRGNCTNPCAPRHGKHILPAHLPEYAGRGSRFYQSHNQEYRPVRQSSRQLRWD